MIDITKLRALRKSLNLTQGQLAKAAGVSQSLIAKIEAGRIDPTYSRVQRLEEAITRLRRETESTAREIMSKNLITARPDESADTIVRTMASKGISQVPVLDGQSIVGLISEASVLEHAQKTPLANLTAKDVMAAAPPLIAQDTPLSAIRSLLAHFPCVIVARQGRTCGIITKSDLLAMMA